MAVLHRPGGLTDADRQFAMRLSKRFEGAGQAREIVGVLGPDVGAGNRPASGERATARSRWCGHALVVVRRAGDARRSRLDGTSGESRDWPSRGLQIRWTGDAVIGRDYMANVQTSLDRAAVATVVLLLIVLLAVYRSFWLALVPLVTIGISLVISRGVLGLDDPGRMGALVAGRAVPDRDPVRYRDGFLSVLVLAVRRALQSEQSGRFDASDAGPFV